MTENLFGSGMIAEEIASFLHQHGTGVLSLCYDSSAYAIPVSFSYDEEENRCILDLGFVPESKKKQFIETTEVSCLTVYEWESPSEWSSVVLSGRLTLLDEVDTELETEFYEEASEIQMIVFDELPEEIEHRWYALDIMEISGRASP